MLRRAGTLRSRVRAPPRGRSTASVTAHARWRLLHMGTRVQKARGTENQQVRANRPRHSAEPIWNVDRSPRTM